MKFKPCPKDVIYGPVHIRGVTADANSLAPSDARPPEGTVLIIQLRPETILGLCLANERRRYLVTTSLIGWVQA